MARIDANNLEGAHVGAISAAVLTVALPAILMAVSTALVAPVLMTVAAAVAAILMAAAFVFVSALSIAVALRQRRLRCGEGEDESGRDGNKLVHFEPLSGPMHNARPTPQFLAEPAGNPSAPEHIAIAPRLFVVCSPQRPAVKFAASVTVTRRPLHPHIGKSPNPSTH